MLLVARWLDSVADAVENNTVASSEKFPWREVIPPLFVGINKHRELLSSKMPRTQFSPKELREFLETEGFIETQGQKLQHLLETKGIPGKGSEAGAGSPSPKPRTPLDDYLDYLLAVAVDSLRKRQKPVVIPKITQHSFEVGEEPDSSCCCDASSSDQTLQSSQDEGFRSRCKTSLWGNLPLFASEKPLPRQRCASCLPIRGSSRAWFGKSNSLRRGFGFPCCYTGENTGPPELDLFESTAMQQVRATACRMPLLPSERYLRYLRLTGRCRELAALAIWLSGRPDLVSSYFERMAPKQQQASAAVRVNSSTPDKGTPRSPPSAESPGGEGGSPPSSPGGTQPEQESTPYADEASRSPIREGEAAREEHKGKDGEECQGSSKGAVLCPSSPVTLPLSSSPRNMGFLGNSLQGKDTDDRAELPTAGEDGLHTEGNHRNDSSGTIHAQSSPRKSPDLPSSPKIRAKLRARAAEPPSDKGNGGLLEGSPHSQRFTATQTSASKAKAKKFVAGRTPVSRVATIGQKTAAGSKPLRPLGQAQWQIPAVPGEPPSARDPQKTAKILATKQETADTAKCEPPESVGTADAMPDSREKESPAPSTRPEDFVESVSPTDADKVVSPTVRRIADTSSKQPREHPSKKQAVAQSKTLTSRSSSTKRLNPAKTTSRRPAAAAQQMRTGALRREVQNAQSSASSTRLTEEAIDLLSEPQVLAEMARLCTRLSDLVCCRSPTSVDCHSGDDEGSSVT
ncbi:uncharacterized protein EMH_0030550 [Eimeria mitis]|uniref:Uncharacterized protein n=1 Tax=Eimeria mitis TaxID=44415 RepID=U6JUV2_9EIME|nr:uncharacterized protein EMH_0030550 [Eimeria mitis]CDJ27303.1 hypothetical protein, conserved [Eimeria mitis]